MKMTFFEEKKLQKITFLVKKFLDSLQKTILSKMLENHGKDNLGGVSHFFGEGLFF